MTDTENKKTMRVLKINALLKIAGGKRNTKM